MEVQGRTVIRPLLSGVSFGGCWEEVVQRQKADSCGRCSLQGQIPPFCLVCSNPCEGRCSMGNALGEAFDVLRRADGILIGSPVYFEDGFSISLRPFGIELGYCREALLNVVGGAITVAASRFGGQEATRLRPCFDMMIIQGMIIVGNGFREADAGHITAPALTLPFG